MDKALRNIFTILATSFTFAGCGIPQKPPSAEAEPAKSKAESSWVIPYDEAAATGVNVAELNEEFALQSPFWLSAHQSFTLVIQHGPDRATTLESRLYGECIEAITQFYNADHGALIVKGMMINTESRGPSYKFSVTGGEIHLEQIVENPMKVVHKKPGL